MSARDVGAMGENTLRMWAAQRGITANKVEQDQTGWDFLLEFPISKHSPGITLPLDREPFPLKCLVQVKASDQQRRSWGIKLDNWIHLVKNPLPTFFLVLEFDEQDDCQRAFLVHVDETYIRRVLQRLREEHINPTAELHEIHLSISYGEADALPSLNGRGLADTILTYVGSKPEEYSTTKMRLVEIVGYEDGNKRVSGHIAIPESVTDVREYLVDFALGLVPRLDIANGEVRDVRFGLTSPEPLHTFSEGGAIEAVRESIGRGTVLLSTLDGKREYRIDTETYGPSLPGVEVSKEYLKFRFAAPYLDFILYPKPVNRVTFHYELPNPGEPQNIEKLRPISEVISFLHDTREKGEELRFLIQFNSLNLLEGMISVEQVFDGQILEMAQSVLNAYAVAKHFDFLPDTEVRIVDLMKQKGQLMFIHHAVASKLLYTRIHFSLDDHSLSYSTRVCIPFATNCVIGTHRVDVVAAIFGPLSEVALAEDGHSEVEVQADEIRLTRSHVYRKGETPRYTKEDLIQSVVKEYEDEMQVILIDNI
jgi:hypothetical protein